MTSRSLRLAALAAALALIGAAHPAGAKTRTGPPTPHHKKAKPGAKTKNTIEVNSFGYGATNPANMAGAFKPGKKR